MEGTAANISMQLVISPLKLQPSNEMTVLFPAQYFLPVKLKLRVVISATALFGAGPAALR